jgi:hypothetical protein
MDPFEQSPTNIGPMPPNLLQPEQDSFQTADEAELEEPLEAKPD